jgi:acetyl-CoA synthetase
MALNAGKVGEFIAAAREDPESFWANAAETLPWRRHWDSVFDWDPEQPDARGRYLRWFIGGETNLAFNCVDRHVESGQGGRAALV